MPFSFSVTEAFGQQRALLRVGRFLRAVELFWEGPFDGDGDEE